MFPLADALHRTESPAAAGAPALFGSKRDRDGGAPPREGSRAPAPPAPAPPRGWTALPEAAALLAACAADPPATRMVKVADLTTYHDRRYVGARVRRLNAIHRAEADRLFAAAERSGDYRAFDAHCRRTVQHAIADALIHAALARSAACDARALEGDAAREDVPIPYRDELGSRREGREAGIAPASTHSPQRGISRPSKGRDR